MNNSFPSGSEWRKWDIHTHTPIDHEWEHKPNNLDSSEVKSSFAKDYVRFAKEKELALIAITDHNFCNDLEDLIIPHIQKEAEKNGITILPGFEITAKDGSGVHLLVIFKEDTDLGLIRNLVLHMFPVSTVLMPADGTVPTSKFSILEIYNFLKDYKDNLEFEIVFAHADRSNGVLKSSTIQGTRRLEEWKRPFINITQISSRKIFENSGFYKDMVNNKNHQYHRKMTYVIASDSRCILRDKQKEGRFHLGEKFTWVKADPTFYGLRQIIHEGKSRVRIQDNRPEQKLDSNIIRRVRFLPNEDCITFPRNWINLNQNLNSIIGGKSSGKSLLLTMIAKSVNHDLDVSKYSQILDNCDFEIEWGDGVTYRVSEGEKYYLDEQNEYLKRRNISHVPQLAIHKLIEENPEEYRNIILSFLNENNDFKDYFKDFQKARENTVEKIENFITQLFKSQSALKRKNKELNDLGDKRAKKKELDIYSKKLTELEGLTISKEEKSEYDKLNGDFELKSKFIKSNEELRESVNVFLELMTRRINELKENINTEYSDASSTMNDSNLTEISSLKEKLNQATSEYINKVELIFSKYSNLKEKSTAAKKERKEIESLLKTISGKTADPKQIDKYRSLIESLETDIDIITAKEIEVSQLNKKIEEITGNISRSYKSLIQLFRELKIEIDSNYRNLINDDNITLTLDIDFNNEKFYSDFFQLFDRRKNISDLSSYFEANHLYEFKVSTHGAMVEEVLNKLVKNGDTYSFKKKNEVDKAIRAVLNDYFELNFRLKQDGEDINQMSYGKKSLVLLKLYLSLNKNESPILIDQPEDNLDNRTIYSELKQFMKDKKIQRQVIIVTHNANLVVSTDAELVVVANQDGQNSKNNKDYKFEYVTGSLENSFKKPEREGILFQMGIKEHVCDILEGGKEAFEERERKYGFK